MLSSSVEVFLVCIILGSATLLADAQCPLKCRCFVLGGKHHVDCYERNLEEPPKYGSDTYEDMNFARNKLRTLPPFSFEQFPGLISLNLSYNFIVNLDESAFKGLSGLEILDLSNNSIVYIKPQFLNPCPGIMWLSLAKNEYIGTEIGKKEVAGRNDTWLAAPSLRTLVLSMCELNVFPPWVVAGLPGLENLDLSYNRLKVLQVLSIVSVCRIRAITLDKNPFSCDRYCENAVTKKYFQDNPQIKLAGNYTFCSNARKGCNVNITEEEEEVRKECLLQDIPKPLARRQPRSIWLYIGAGCGALVGLFFMAILFNGMVSTCRRSESPPPSPKSPHARTVQQELILIRNRPENHYKEYDSDESFDQTQELV